MHQSEVSPPKLRKLVEAEFVRYARAYQTPPTGTTVGVPWSKEKIDAEVEAMVSFLVEPYVVEYVSGDDMLPPEQRLVGNRSAFVVARDQSYMLLFDHEEEDFVLAFEHTDGRLTAWGIRGDATSTFLAR
jgi:hypothetical protein